jgi:hypothetical protein
MPALVRRGCSAALAALLILCTSGLVLGAPQVRQARQTAPAAPVAQQAVSQPPVAYAPSQTAQQTRSELERVLSHYSPAVGRVLVLDPLLLQNAAYLSSYPELVAFLAQHPEVAHNASFYFAEYRTDYYPVQDRESRILSMWSGFFAGLALFLVFCIVTGVLVWLIKTLTESRRWARLFKAQTEARNKLLDRFGTNEDLLAYIATPAGKRFLESTPVELGPTSTSVGGPMRRILWASEVGVVLACGGGGLLIARQNLPGELPQMLWLIAVFAISLGIGFILAAGASYLLSRRMGILGSAVSRDERTTDAHPTE